MTEILKMHCEAMSRLVRNECLNKIHCKFFSFIAPLYSYVLLSGLYVKIIMLYKLCHVKFHNKQIYDQHGILISSKTIDLRQYFKKEETDYNVCLDILIRFHRPTSLILY